MKTGARKPTASTGRADAGIVLVAVLVMILFMSAICGVTYVSLARDLAVAQEFSNGVVALQQADAGARYVLARIRKDILAGRIAPGLPSDVGTHQPVDYRPPKGLVFTPIGSLLRLGDGRSFEYTVASSADGTRAAVKVTVVIPDEGPPQLADGPTATATADDDSAADALDSPAASPGSIAMIASWQQLW